MHEEVHPQSTETKMNTQPPSSRKKCIGCVCMRQVTKELPKLPFLGNQVDWDFIVGSSGHTLNSQLLAFILPSALWFLKLWNLCDVPSAGVYRSKYMFVIFQMPNTFLWCSIFMWLLESSAFSITRFERVTISKTSFRKRCNANNLFTLQDCGCCIEVR